MHSIQSLYYNPDGFKGTVRATNSPDGLPVRHSTDDSDSLRSPAGYVPDSDLAAAINTAIILGRPLLVTGEPGTGKSDLAAHIAFRLRLGTRIKLDVKSTSTSTDLFYTFDALRQFRDANRLGTPADPMAPLPSKSTPTSVANFAVEPRPKFGSDASWIRPYITFRGLGLAILRTHEPNHPTVIRYWDEPRYGIFDGPKRSVVLIDEVDKAPRDMLNDLLNELELHYFRVMEDEGQALTLQGGLVPVVVVTSNSEKSLPDAFLRRCVFHHLSFPDINVQDPKTRDSETTRVRTIVASRFAQYPTSCNLLTDAIALMRELRSETLGLSKPPATAELLDWLKLLHEVGFKRDDRLQGRPELHSTLGALVKNSDDRRVVESRLGQTWLGLNGQPTNDSA